MRLACALVTVVTLSGCLNSFERAEHVVQGFGALAGGAADSPTGTSICVVTLSEGTGPGSIYDCVSAAGREVHFDVAEVTLGSDLTLRNPYVTIAGETAPAPGLTIVQPRGVLSSIRASHVQLRYFRIRGPGPHTDAGGETHKLFQLDGADMLVEGIAVHHVTAIGADGAFDAFGTVQNVTIERCIVRDMGAALILQGAGAIRDQISIHHNLFANNEERQPLVRGQSRTIDIRNNIIFGWNDAAEGGNGIQIDATSGETPSLNMVSNIIMHPDGLFGDAALVMTNPGRGVIFAEGNRLPPDESDMRTATTEVAIAEFARVNTTPVSELASDVLGDVGSTHQDDAALIEIVRAALD